VRRDNHEGDYQTMTYVQVIGVLAFERAVEKSQVEEGKEDASDPQRLLSGTAYKPSEHGQVEERRRKKKPSGGNPKVRKVVVNGAGNGMKEEESKPAPSRRKDRLLPCPVERDLPGSCGLPRLQRT